MIEKKGNLLQKINSLSHSEFERLCLADNICPECAEDDRLCELKRKDGETVCPICGVVWKNEQFSNIIPFGDATKPVNLLAEGKGLGGTLQERGLFCLLAKQSATGIQDLPIRARHTMIITSKHEHPRLASLLKFGNRRCKEYGLADHATKPKDFLIKNMYGEMLRTIGSYYVVRGLRFDTQMIADGCFALTVKAILGQSDFEETKQHLHLQEAVINQIQLLYEVLKIE